MDRIRYERELYEPLREHFRRGGFEVRSEVNGCDLVARKQGYVLVVEMKRHLSFDLLAQAVERQAYADAVYVGVPKPADLKVDKAWRSKLRVLRQLGLGLLLVARIGLTYTVEEALAPGAHSAGRASTRKRRSLESEFDGRSLDLNTGGSHAMPLVTAYREAALYAAYLLHEFGPQTAKELRSRGAHPRRTAALLSANHYGWFAKSDAGGYALTEAGLAALTVYAPLVGAFAEAQAGSDDPEQPRN